ncbi:MAG: hypothetical protein HY544_05150 [Candidatus Diapherotrites archaeon]|uniref:Uncharacterized protein n=1 Tax=Candidatus Iainarchaeum sp. TaxID=3101447 RepID=A0A8T3YLE3_9ARCH|nr:hypothetical protein [Candidatus Diapherotrites archaeon]
MGLPANLSESFSYNYALLKPAEIVYKNEKIGEVNSLFLKNLLTIGGKTFHFRYTNLFSFDRGAEIADESGHVTASIMIKQVLSEIVKLNFPETKITIGNKVFARTGTSIPQVLSDIAAKGSHVGVYVNDSSKNPAFASYKQLENLLKVNCHYDPAELSLQESVFFAVLVIKLFYEGTHSR